MIEQIPNLPERPVLALVPPGEMTAQDFLWLQNADDVQPATYKMTQLQVETGQRKGSMQLWRLRDKPGAMLTEIATGPNGARRLSILRGAAHAFGPQMRPVARFLGRMAAVWGCDGVETVVWSGRLAKAIQLCGAQAEGLIMFLPVEK